MKIPIVTLFTLCCAMYSLVAADPAPAGKDALEHITAAGVTFDYPGKLTLVKDDDESGPMLNFRSGENLPWILVQIYTVKVTPEKAMEVNVRHHRELCFRKNWKLTITQAQTMIAGRNCKGIEMRYTAGETPFLQRFFTLELNGHTVFLMSMYKAADEEFTQQLSAPIASSIH